MSYKHRDPTFRKHARIIRQNVARRRRFGEEVTCWRCGREILEEQAFDVGHIDAEGGSAISNLAPEHRYKIPGICRGNRSAGGTLGRQRQQTNHTEPRRSDNLLRW